ncbi:tetratricopeptide repeat protein [Leptolyngbya ohadii]|uniref:tetratricopeptide repeat protein n=1 Tax=Leptolyngbya ohadii TaxID=1962290 RepID=UPI000B59B39C|nr:tetratricopeptide repeat protein [Leptolyngbya ohadii]
MKSLSLIRLLSVLSALTLTVSLPAVAQADPLTRQGYTLLDRGWVNDAIPAFRRALQNNPRSLEARLGLAIAYQRAGQDSNAWNAYQQVIQQDPNNRQALAAIGLLGTYRPEWNQGGINALTALLNLTPTDRKLRAQRALLYGYQGQFEAAIGDYEILLTETVQPETLLQAAQIYTYSGDFITGRELFDRYRAGATIPNSAISAYAQTLQATGDVPQSIEILETRLQSIRSLDPSAMDMRSVLAVSYAMNQQVDRAFTVLEPLRDIKAARLPLARALSAIGRTFSDAEPYEAAVTLYRQALAETPNPSAGLMREVADVMSESQIALAEAIQLYDRLIVQQPQKPSIQVKRAIAAYDLRQISRPQLEQTLKTILATLPASAVERRAITIGLNRLTPPDTGLLPIYQALRDVAANVPFLYFRLAQIALEQGNFAGTRSAIAEYQATPRGSTDLGVELLLAELERQEGNLDGSADRYDKLIQTTETQPFQIKIYEDAMRGLAGVRLMQGRSEDALKIYDRLIARNPDDLSSQMGRASIAYALNQISEAEAEAVLSQWEPSAAPSVTAPSVAVPPELFLLVSTLPAAESRSSLYDTLLAIDPNNLGINRRWVQLWASRDADRATARVNELITANPNDASVYFLQGELAQQLGNLTQAGEAYETILTQQPNNSDALLALGGVRFEQQQLSEARTLFERVLALRPNDPEILRILAEISLAQDQPVAALNQLREMEQSSPEPNSQISDRLDQLQIDLLRRRGFQPSWERY